MRSRNIFTDNEHFYAVEHHFFKANGRWLLFNVNALKVTVSCILDKKILDSANNGENVRGILEEAVREGADRSETLEHIEFLIEKRFLLRPWEKPEQAKLAESTSYATFMINVSQRCNLTCSYCYVNKGLFDYEDEPLSFMPVSATEELVKKVFENFQGFQTYAFHFYGGEPLMNFGAIQQIVEVAEKMAAAYGKETEYHITTNGTLLGQDVADFMDKHKFTVYFSVDGDEAVHDEVRRYANGEGSYKDVEKNLEYLRTKPGVHFIGSSVVRKGFTLESAVNYLVDIGANQCKVERVRLNDGENLTLSGEDHDCYIQEVAALAGHYIKYLAEGKKPVDFRLSSKILQLLTGTRRDFFCPAGERMFGISGNGELYPCALHVGRSNSKIGDVRNGIEKDKQINFYSRFKLENHENCKICWARYLCGGGCSAMIDRFRHEDCRSLRAESEAAIAVYSHFMENDPVKLYGLVSPSLVGWINGELD